MNTFFNAMTTNDSITANGAVTHSTSSSACLDLFFLIGASRDKNISDIVNLAFNESKELCTRIMLWSRDIRHGAGERKHIKDFITYLESSNEIDLAVKVIKMLPELGRWDDMLQVTHTTLKELVGALTYYAIHHDRDGLCAKWMPRENSANGHIAKWIMEQWQVSPRQYRKALTQCTNVVETKMCSNKWGDIEYSHVPSKAMTKYSNAFNKHDSDRFTGYKQALLEGRTKVNAGAVYPHEILQLATKDSMLATQMWKALPNFLDPLVTNSILPVCDVSGSMEGLPMDISVSLGTYIAQRNTGPFKDIMIGFNGDPHTFKVPSLDSSFNLRDVYNNMYEKFAHNMDTNLQAVFDRLLQILNDKKISIEDMPKTLLIISDMEFNYCGRYTNLELIKSKYQQSNYPMPNLIFWNIDGRSGNIPVKMNEQGVALVSGYSPSILKSVLCNEVDPMKIMLKTVMKERYTY